MTHVCAYYIPSKIKLGTMMTGIIYRHPSILAKIGATLDVLSKGRLFMGIGAARNEEAQLIYCRWNCRNHGTGIIFLGV